MAKASQIAKQVPKRDRPPEHWAQKTGTFAASPLTPILMDIRIHSTPQAQSPQGRDEAGQPTRQASPKVPKMSGTATMNGKGAQAGEARKCKQKDKQKQPEDRDKGNEARGAQFNLGPRLSPENRQANPKRGTTPIQQKPITVLRLNKNRMIIFRQTGRATR